MQRKKRICLSLKLMKNSYLDYSILAINDIWAYKVILKKYSKTGNNYNATYEITLWDHFGLDLLY